MLLSHREMHVPELDLRLDTHAVVHTRYRVHVVERRNVVSEDALLLRSFDRLGHLSRPTLTVLLEGRARIRACGQERWLSAGDMALIEAKAGVEMRQDGAPSFLSLAIEWEPGPISCARPAGFTTGRLDAAGTAALHEAAGALRARHTAPDRASAWLARIVAVLRASGSPLDLAPAPDLIEPVPDGMRRVGAALDGLLSNLRGRPTSVDLETALGLGARQVNRVVAEFNERYGFNATGWRDTRLRRQLLMGATLMTAPGAHVEGIAEAVGYGSARAFQRALADASLPSASAIASIVRGLE